jgi:3-hydroxymyristoyl/3-hydroxydecanoyl-(acyl carrier protein) dehydratase
MSKKWHDLCFEQSEQEPTVSARILIDKASPWFSGHFPSEPILPGVAVLAMVKDVIINHESRKGRRIRISNIRRVRFRLPIRPGAMLSITLSSPDVDRAYLFKVAVDGETACTGIMMIDPL